MLSHGAVHVTLISRVNFNFLQDMIVKVDKDGSGTVELDEFVSLLGLMKELYRVSEEEIKGTFKIFDRNGDGSISSDELREVMTSVGAKLTEDEITAMIDEADADADGSVDYEEFLKMMLPPP